MAFNHQIKGIASRWWRGTPLLDDSSAWFDCALHQVVDAGDHALMIGRIEGFACRRPPGWATLYRGAYFTPLSQC
ncbi:flavin reductase family protein [Candidatus Pantoea persica]|uniref:flavin reductase family protein n=1 Tax=Candidatus Pantoea persica TaxID=2518128 RepID=UPI00215D7AEE|nr:flavin reductase family protein [Candidatus Pantoea persica]